jgi:nucleotide-binding universal stress UspA family protein
MDMPKKILCATDGSAHSEPAVAFAARLAKSTDAALIYLAVEPFALDRAGTWPLWADGAAAEKLDSATRIAEKMGVTTVNRIEAQAVDVADAILTCAAKADADLVIVGSRGRGPIQRLLRGSISNQVLNKAHVPVTVVH